MNTNNNIPLLSGLTDEEILQRVYLDNAATQMEVELAHRLEHALDELSSKSVSLSEIINKRSERL